MADVCPNCHLALCPPEQPWDLGTHCPRSLRSVSSSPDTIALAKLVSDRECLRIGLDLRDAQQAKTKSLLALLLQQLTDGIALIDQGEDLPRYQTPELTSARIEAQDRVNQELRLKLSKLGEPIEDGSDTLLVVARPGRRSGSPTVGHSRLPLAQIIGMIRNGETLQGLKNCWGGYPDEFWRVCIALAGELMPVPEPEEEAEHEADLAREEAVIRG
jgi:uncharacterized protein (DUF433 family)